MMQVKGVTAEREFVIKSLPAYFGENSEELITVKDVGIRYNRFLCCSLILVQLTAALDYGLREEYSDFF
jgi:hypothetical protein